MLVMLSSIFLSFAVALNVTHKKIRKLEMMSLLQSGRSSLSVFEDLSSNISTNVVEDEVMDNKEKERQREKSGVYGFITTTADAITHRGRRSSIGQSSQNPFSADDEKDEVSDVFGSS